MSPRSRGLMLSVLGVLSVAGVAQGQQLSLTVTGGSPLVFPTPTETDYDNGVLSASSALGFTVDLSGAGPGVQRTATVSIRAVSPFMGATKPISNMQWRRSDLVTWNSMTTSNVTIRSLPMKQTPVLNDPWVATLFFRVLISWAADGPGIYDTTLILTSTLTTP